MAHRVLKLVKKCDDVAIMNIDFAETSNNQGCARFPFRKYDSVANILFASASTSWIVKTIVRVFVVHFEMSILPDDG
jgi:hypothetical protein